MSGICVRTDDTVCKCLTAERMFQSPEVHLQVAVTLVRNASPLLLPPHHRISPDSLTVLRPILSIKMTSWAKSDGDVSTCAQADVATCDYISSPRKRCRGSGGCKMVRDNCDTVEVSRRRWLRSNVNVPKTEGDTATAHIIAEPAVFCGLHDLAGMLVRTMHYASMRKFQL
ncbi:hypothetical protein BDW22DRAFT_322538 [Trametopsis cervina]|nr:hypothetical protein BDW22DRAFT_322538 [Trametopsis cervina]